MPFCAPIWKWFFRRDADQGTDSKTGKPRDLTAEEKLKEQRRKEVEQLREILRMRRELLDGTVEVPLRNSTPIEGYQIRVVRGPSPVVAKLPPTKSPCTEPTKESMENFSKFIESKIKEKKEKDRANAKGKTFEEKPDTISKDPVQDALIKRLLELQAERDIKKKEQKIKKSARKHRKLEKDESEAECHCTAKPKSKEDANNDKRKAEKHSSKSSLEHDDESDQEKEGGEKTRKRKRTEAKKKCAKDGHSEKAEHASKKRTKDGHSEKGEHARKKRAKDGHTEKAEHDGSPKSKKPSEGKKSTDHPSVEHEHLTSSAEHHDEPHGPSESKDDDYHGRESHDKKPPKAGDHGGKHETDVDTEGHEKEADMGKNEGHKPSIKSKKSTDKK